MMPYLKKVAIDFELPTDSCADCPKFKPIMKERKTMDVDGGWFHERVKSCEEASFCITILMGNGVRVGE